MNDIMDRLYHRLAPLAFMPTEVSQEEAKRLGYPYVKLSDVETVVRAELQRETMNRKDLVKELRKAAEEIAIDGHSGWGNLCTMAADALDDHSLAAHDQPKEE